MRWSAVFAGTALAVGLWILLQTLGVGLGLAAVHLDNAGRIRGVGIGTGIWSLVASLIAMFLGAYVVGRLSSSRDSFVGAMHGGVMWALSTILGLGLMLSLVSSMASGAVRVGGAAAGATSSLVSGAVSAGANVDADALMKQLGIDTSDLLAPINERLERQGKPKIAEGQLNATIRAVAKRGVREGKLDRQVLVEELARNTSLSRADAEDIANQFGDRYQELSTRLSNRINELGENAKHAALTAAKKTGKALALGGVMMLLSLGAAIGGSVLGARGTRREGELPREGGERTAPPTTVVPPPAPQSTTE